MRRDGSQEGQEKTGGISPLPASPKPGSGDQKKGQRREVVEAFSGASIGENFPFVTEPRDKCSSLSQVGGRVIPTLR